MNVNGKRGRIAHVLTKKDSRDESSEERLESHLEENFRHSDPFCGQMDLVPFWRIVTDFNDCRLIGDKVRIVDPQCALVFAKESLILLTVRVVGVLEHTKISHFLLF